MAERDIEIASEAAAQFTNDERLRVEWLGTGLIHRTFKVTENSTNQTFILQAINNRVFQSPWDLVYNYDQIFRWLRRQESPLKIPSPRVTAFGQLLWQDKHETYWRAMAFVPQSCTYPVVRAADQASEVAQTFGLFSRSLSDLEPTSLRVIIPGFHNIHFRFERLQEAIAEATPGRLSSARQLVDEIDEKIAIVGFFDKIEQNLQFRSRIMHHDCKISNILFDALTGEVICPVDLDTVMPGLFFSDLGDMFRTICCPLDENSVEWNHIEVRPEFYKSLLSGYLDQMGPVLTKDELAHIHYAGMAMTFMQALRFLTDFLRSDTYYRTQYPEQNLDRTKNQLELLKKLQHFIGQEYNYRVEAI